jgi:hypothetical protein
MVQLKDKENAKEKTNEHIIFKNLILIGYYTVLCSIWKYIVRVCSVLITRIQNK